MLLVVDVGNTETTLGLCEGEVVTDHWRITTEASRTPDEVFMLLKSLLAANGIVAERVTSGAIGSPSDIECERPGARQAPAAATAGSRDSGHATTTSGRCATSASRLRAARHSV